jgi:hypothetical protein
MLCRRLSRRRANGAAQKKGKNGDNERDSGG